MDSKECRGKRFDQMQAFPMAASLKATRLIAPPILGGLSSCVNLTQVTSTSNVRTGAPCARDLSEPLPTREPVGSPRVS
ncbi:hypothetical protein ABIA95_005454 [Bradyrhizobium sp. LA8.1]|jgi:hypothetical protein